MAHQGSECDDGDGRNCGEASPRRRQLKLPPSNEDRKVLLPPHQKTEKGASFSFGLEGKMRGGGNPAKADLDQGKQKREPLIRFAKKRKIREERRKGTAILLEGRRKAAQYQGKECSLP